MLQHRYNSCAWCFFQIWGAEIEKLGAVVQVISDSAASCKAAGAIIEEEFVIYNLLHVSTLPPSTDFGELSSC